MTKKRINPKEATADIQSGMDDSSLMKKYSLAPEGLQSLFDKLVTCGYLDVAEIQQRMPGHVGTVSVADPVKQEAILSRGSHGGAWINAQEAARDIRSGMDDYELMEKFRVSSRGLQSLFDKLVVLGIITQGDLDRRSLGLQQHTVALSGEDILSLTGVLQHLGPEHHKTETKVAPHRSAGSPHTGKDTTKIVASPNKSGDKELPEIDWETGTEARWYDNPYLVVLSLIGLFPLGLYALYQSNGLSRRLKAIVAVAWLSLALFALLLVSETLNQHWF
jgi:hypothetical protein